MRKSRKVTPSTEITSKIIKGVSVDEIFDEELFVERSLITRHRIIGVFNFAVDPITKKGTDNFIVGASERLSCLADYVIRHMSHPHTLVTDYDLPDVYYQLPSYWRNKVITQVCRELVLDQLILLRDAQEIYYQDGRWQALQSLVDEYAKRREVAKHHFLMLQERRQAARVKDDMRPFHGRPRRQTKARNIAPGTSVGGAVYAH